MKYVRRETSDVDAVQWMEGDVNIVAEFLEFLRRHELKLSLCSSIDGGVDAEIYNCHGTYLIDVSPTEFLVVGPDRAPEAMGEVEFRREFRVAE